jgi:Uma2 family endonuclease
VPGAPAEGYGAEDFPGCESFHLPEGELEGYEGRLEFWDGYTETAWKVSEPTSIQHEGPSRRLARVTERIAALRGLPIASFGSSDLVQRDAAGRLRWLMQADEVLYLHPERTRLRGPKIDVDADPLPDVVLEVDHSTDVRRRKLGIYQESGFPEVWVLVPRESSLRAPGLTIHVHRDDAYREEAESRAFPGWKAEEVYRALTEDPLSAGAMRALERVALTMGEREGTKPEDDPFTRSLSLKAEARGDAKGYENGYENGYLRGREHGRKEALAENVVALLEARGIVATLDSEEDRALFDALSAEALMAAALACSGAADFRRRLRKAAR